MKKKCPKCGADLNKVGFCVKSEGVQYWRADKGAFVPGSRVDQSTGPAVCILCDTALPWSQNDLIGHAQEVAA